MEQKINDWLLWLTRIDSCGNRIVSHVCLHDMSKTQVMELAKELRNIAKILLLFVYLNLRICFDSYSSPRGFRALKRGPASIILLTI